MSVTVWNTYTYFRLAVDTLQTRFNVEFEKESKFETYGKCLTNASNKKGTILSYLAQRVFFQMPFTPAYECKRFLNRICGEYFDSKRESNCFNKTCPSNGNCQSNIGYPQASDVHYTFNGADEYKAFTNHNHCIQEVEKISRQCVPLLKADCQTSSIRTAKLIRLRMENVANVLKQDPSVKVIHYFRDPRGL